jgi:surface polysaccharide O-acyltransferase-like enzyme
LNTRDGPFFGTLLVATGYILSARNPKRSWAMWGLAILAAGLILHCSEFELLRAYLHSKPLPVALKDFTFGTFGMGLGSLMVAVANPGWLTSPLPARVGRFTLGIYCVHFYFVKQLDPIVTALHNPVSEAIFPPVVFVLSLLAVWMLSKSSLTRRFVQ